MYWAILDKNQKYALLFYLSRQPRIDNSTYKEMYCMYVRQHQSNCIWYSSYSSYQLNLQFECTIERETNDIFVLRFVFSLSEWKMWRMKEFYKTIASSNFSYFISLRKYLRRVFVCLGVYVSSAKTTNKSWNILKRRGFFVYSYIYMRTAACLFFFR